MPKGNCPNPPNGENAGPSMKNPKSAAIELKRTKGSVNVNGVNGSLPKRRSLQKNGLWPGEC